MPTKLLTWFCIIANVIVHAEEISTVKLIAVDNPNAKRTPQQKQRKEVFATRALAFLKKDGDLFKVHRPGLLGKEKTVSFESVRLPGFFLRQKNKKVHLDNLKSRYILKDATFKESKDAIGETFRLFLHDNLFLCHTSDHGFNLLMQPDSPTRDTLNCAFNIIEQKSNKKEIVLNSTKPKAHVASYIKNKTTGESIPEFKDLVDAIKQNKDPFPVQPGGGFVVVSNKPGNEKAGKDSGKLKAQKPAQGKAEIVGKTNDAKVGGAKANDAKGTVAKAKNAKIAAAKAKDAGGKPVEAKNKGAKTAATNGKAAKVATEKVTPSKTPEAKFAEAKFKNAKAVAEKLKEAVANKNVLKHVGDAKNLKNQKPAVPQTVPVKRPSSGFIVTPGVAKQKPFAFQTPQPIHESDKAFFKPWLYKNQITNAFSSNPFMQQQQFQQAFARKKAFMQQAFAKQQALKKEAIARQQWLIKRNQYFKNAAFKANQQQLKQQRAHQVSPSSRQIVSHVFQPPVPIHETNVIGQEIQYVPPSQWKNILNLPEASLSKVPSPVHEWTHTAEDLVKGHTSVATNTYAADTLLTKLHPELNLMHSAHHDVNEVTTTDPNIHHLETAPAFGHLFPNHPTPVQITAIPHEAASHAGLAASATEPLAVVEHINLPSVTPIAGHGHDVSVHVSHTPQLVVTTEHRPSFVTSNLEAANELVHTNPDITLKEAFDKLEPSYDQPLEIASEPLHHIHAAPRPDKAFHMRTHYVAGKPIDMSDEDEESMKEVHVVHHNHHLVHASNNDEQQKFVSTLVDNVNDLCISLVFVNELADRYRLVSTINPHGYRPKGNKFSLKTIFKEPKTRKVMSFKAYDEEDPHRSVLLNGHKEYNVYPSSCSKDPVNVVVDSAVSKTSIVTGDKKSKVGAHKRNTQPCTRVTGGTSGSSSCCIFPFTFKGKSYSNCIPFGDDGKRKWCSLTSNFDAERRWGMCSIPDLSVLQPEPTEEDNNSMCPKTCGSECGKECPMACCSDSSSSLLH